MEQINHWSCTNNFYKKTLTGAIFLLAPAANYAWYKPIFYSLHELAACCYFGVDLGNGLDHNSLSRLADGTPHSSFDLLYLTLPLPFTWTKYSKSNFLLPFCLFGQKVSESKFLFLTQKKSLFLPTNSTLMPLESKKCPLTLASVLACVDSADELRF